LDRCNIGLLYDRKTISIFISRDAVRILIEESTWNWSRHGESNEEGDTN